MVHDRRQMASLIRHRTDQTMMWGPWSPVTWNEWHELYPKRVAEAGGFYLFRNEKWNRYFVIKNRGVREGFWRAHVRMDDKLREAFGLEAEE